MSVLIKGMEMPESCWKCPLETDYGTCGYYSMFVEAGHDSDYEKRPDDCPLIELPTIEPFSTSGYVTTVTDLPPVEYVPVVRCKDCKWWREETDHTCRKWGGASPRNANGYCDDAERSEE